MTSADIMVLKIIIKGLLTSFYCALPLYGLIQH